MDWGFVTDRLATTFRKETWVGGHERRFVSETLYGHGPAPAPDRSRARARAPRRRSRRAISSACSRCSCSRGCSSRRAPRSVEPRSRLERGRGDRRGDRGRAQAGDADRARGVAARLARAAARRRLGRRGGGARARAQPARADDGAREHARRRSRRARGRARRGEARDARRAQWSDTALVVDSADEPVRARRRSSAARWRRRTKAASCSPISRRPPAASRSWSIYCAGAGGKTLAIAARLAIAAASSRATSTARSSRSCAAARAARACRTRRRVLDRRRHWPRELDALRGKADVVFVDAPCSGIGALRRNPEARWRMREADIAGFVARQTRDHDGRARPRGAGRTRRLRDVLAARRQKTTEWPRTCPASSACR